MATKTKPNPDLFVSFPNGQVSVEIGSNAHKALKWSLNNACVKQYKFDITPVPAPRMTSGQVKLLHMPDYKIDKTGLATKRRLEKYFAFKQGLQHLANIQKFKLPDSNFMIVFYLPVPDGKKGKDLIGTPHQVKPDADNLLKAVKDALSKKDETIYHYEVAKFWGEVGRITITVHK